MRYRQAGHNRRHQRGTKRAAATLTAAIALFTGLLTATPAAQALASAGHPAARPARAHHVPGLAHPRRIPQRAPAEAHLLGRSRAVPGKQAPRSQPHYSAEQQADLAAAMQARRTGKSVLVPTQTTQTMEVLAHPDGKFELISNALPVRVRANGRWTPISTTLRRGPGGSWSAPLTSAPVRFSGGGAGAMVTVTSPAARRSVSVSWPYRLPRPVVSGSVALYPGVLPGVDLRLQATSTGYSEVLIVKDAAAAADPRLRRLTFTLQGGPGVAVRPGAHGRNRPGGRMIYYLALTHQERA